MTHNYFTHALVRPPTANMSDGLTTQDLGLPDFSLALAQHRAYVETLRTLGLNITELPPDDRYPDGCFVEDTAVIRGDVVVITQPGAPSRFGEPAAIQAFFGQHSAARLVCMQGDERLDGGDVLECADRVLIGVGKRTNRAGAEHLKAALQEREPGLPVHLIDFDGMLHLKSGLNELAPGVLLHAPELIFEEDPAYGQIHTLPASESYSANIVIINDAAVIPAGYPTVMTLAEQHYTKVILLEMSEFARMDGGLTCLSLRYAF